MQPPSADILVSFSTKDLANALRSISFFPDQGSAAAIDRGLMFSTNRRPSFCSRDWRSFGRP